MKTMRRKPRTTSRLVFARSRITRPSTNSRAEYEPHALALHSILVPVDFSECSKKALVYAKAFAGQFGAKLTVVHVIKPYIPVPEATLVDVGLIERNLRKTAEVQMAELQRNLGGAIAFRAVLHTGNPAIEIVKAAKSHGSDLIVISTHGRTGMGRWLIGSTAEKVIRHAGCPVLVVREHEHECLWAAQRKNGGPRLKKTKKERRSL